MNQDTIILAGGGTGGHVFPMIAVADELRQLAPSLRVVFVGTERGIESQVVPERGYELSFVRIAPIRGRGVFGAVKGVGTAAQAIPEALKLVKALKPKAIFSIGGYAAGSISVAARILGIPLALMEPNSVIGLANRLVAPFVQRAYTTFPEVEKYFPGGAVLRSGVAIRRGFEPQVYTYAEGPLRVLVLGGSQGAKALNETVPEALSQAKAAVSVVHQAGKGHDGAVRERYARLGGTDVSVVPFISDMPRAIAEADLVVSRSGASAVSEICAIGRPAMFIPYPYASGDHQYLNALSVENRGGAVCIRADQATAPRIASELDSLLSDAGRLRQMAFAAQELGKPEAAEVVASDLLELGNIPLEDMNDEAADLGGDTGTKAPSEVH